jgi:arabinose-5-phosphate isomerase
VTDERLARARRVLDVEGAAIGALRDRLDASVARAIDILLACTGKVVVTGVGKSGIVCRKIAATLASTGTPAFFLHAGEGSHGDLGTLVRGDVLLAVSNSGENEEVLNLLPVARRLDLPLIVVTGRPDSTLARGADVVLDVSVPEEACPLGLAPTASTTVTMALGDALAIALLEERGFSIDDFALLHPAGALGRRLRRVEDLMHRDGEVPLVQADASLKDTLLEMTSKRLGLTGVVNTQGELIGVVTDGDLRRPREHGRRPHPLGARPHGSAPAV